MQHRTILAVTSLVTLGCVLVYFLFSDRQVTSYPSARINVSHAGTKSVIDSNVIRTPIREYPINKLNSGFSVDNQKPNQNNYQQEAGQAGDKQRDIAILENQWKEKRNYRDLENIIVELNYLMRSETEPEKTRMVAAELRSYYALAEQEQESSGAPYVVHNGSEVETTEMQQQQDAIANDVPITVHEKSVGGKTFMQNVTDSQCEN